MVRMLALMPCNGFGNLFSRKLAVTRSGVHRLLKESLLQTLPSFSSLKSWDVVSAGLCGFAIDMFPALWSAKSQLCLSS